MVSQYTFQHGNVRYSQPFPTFVGNITPAKVDEIFRAHWLSIFNFLLIMGSPHISFTSDPKNFTREKVGQIVDCLSTFSDAVLEKKTAIQLREQDLAMNQGPTLFSDAMFHDLLQKDAEIAKAVLRLDQTTTKNGITINYLYV